MDTVCVLAPMVFFVEWHRTRPCRAQEGEVREESGTSGSGCGARGAGMSHGVGATMALPFSIWIF